MIILDTNVLSEVFRPDPSDAVIAWLGAQEPLSVFITAITQAEVLDGLEVLPDGKRRKRLFEAIEKVLVEEFLGRILSFDEDAARLYPKIVSGRNALGRPISQFDAMIAATTLARRATLATRNTSDFEHCGIRIVNPWNQP
jgi:predicted nucleic acid-binding protein